MTAHTRPYEPLPVRIDAHPRIASVEIMRLELENERLRDAISEFTRSMKISLKFLEDSING